LVANLSWSKLPYMRRRLVLVFVFIGAGVAVQAAARRSAQTLANPDVQQNRVVLSRLAAPVYPPLAQQAHIEGDVELTVRVRRDGSVESARLFRGHPMLATSALDSARQSQFECHRCSEEVTSYILTYKFQIAPRDPPKNCHGEPDPPPPHSDVGIAHNQVTLFAWEIWTCDPAVEIHRFRAAKCWYLWRCGVRERSLD
jgi:TonB family protein